LHSNELAVIPVGSLNISDEKERDSELEDVIDTDRDKMGDV